MYRSFVDTNKDPFYQSGEDAEDRHALLRGLFLTAFLADDFLGDADYFGAKQAIILSASSKTAIGVAECAAARGVGQVIGLTSARNTDFVRSIGCYSEVVAYDDIGQLAVNADAVSIDMAGNAGVLAQLHERFGDRLKYSMTVGKSHANSPAHPPPTKGPQPQMFFAPSQVQKRVQEWGRDGYQKRTAEAMHRFIDSSRRWLEVDRATGPDRVTQTWLDTFDGAVPPSSGRIVSV